MKTCSKCDAEFEGEGEYCAACLESFTELSDRDLHRLYDEYLDETYPECEIAGLSYNTSRALAEIDPTAYNVGFSDWLDREISESGVIFECNGKYYTEE
jgi:hypothetical protein